MVFDVGAEYTRLELASQSRTPAPDSVVFAADGTPTFGSDIVAGVLAQLEREGRGAFISPAASPMAAIRAELFRAYAKHGQEPWGRHEFYGILKEEVDELWDAIKADEPMERVHAEAVQVAAMCVRYIETGDRYGNHYDVGRASRPGAAGSSAGSPGGGQGG